jgi:hypothetical protein
MILNAHRKRDLFTIEDIAMVDLLANDEMTERVAIPQIRHAGNYECEQGRKKKQWLL